MKKSSLLQHRKRKMIVTVKSQSWRKIKIGITLTTISPWVGSPTFQWPNQWGLPWLKNPKRKDFKLSPLMSLFKECIIIWPNPLPLSPCKGKRKKQIISFSKTNPKGIRQIKSLSYSVSPSMSCKDPPKGELRSRMKNFSGRTANAWRTTLLVNLS